MAINTESVESAEATFDLTVGELEHDLPEDQQTPTPQTCAVWYCF